MLPKRQPRPKKGSTTETTATNTNTSTGVQNDSEITPDLRIDNKQNSPSKIQAPSSQKTSAPRNKTPHISDFEQVLLKNIEEERHNFNENQQHTDRAHTPLSQRKIQKKKATYADSSTDPDTTTTGRTTIALETETNDLLDRNIKKLEPTAFSYFDRLAYVDYSKPLEEQK